MAVVANNSFRSDSRRLEERAGGDEDIGSGAPIRG
jgi:hypothetical protein